VRLDANLPFVADQAVVVPLIKQLTPQSHGGKGDAASRDIGLRYRIRPPLLIPDPETAQLPPAGPAGDGSIGKINFN
jgi:hypothetical protein